MQGESKDIYQTIYYYVGTVLTLFPIDEFEAFSIVSGDPAKEY